MNESSLIGKILIKGDLILKSPLLIGDGTSDTQDNRSEEISNKFRDVHVLKNHDGKPFIPGTSLCGVLRDWLKNKNKTSPECLPEIFGDANDMQSSIQFNDIELPNGKIISRDGVRLDGLTDVVDGDGKYDYEVIERGAAGNLRILINLRGCHSTENISEVTAQMLRKLQDGIRLGALTTKGFGLVTVENLDASFYDFRDGEAVAAWLLGNSSTKKIAPSAKSNSASEKDFVVDAEFIFNSSFIIRDYDVTKTDRDKNISAVMLKSRADFVIPGTSLKGILRHRAEYICNKLGFAKDFLEDLMGFTGKKSRLIVAESYVAPKNFAEVEHTRNKIDRFTSGTLQGTLFTTKPAYQKISDAPTFKLHFEIHNAEDHEAGLAIFLLRDLWLGRVAVGGEKSIGRGTVKGLSAEINFNGKSYRLGENGRVISGNSSELENFAAALKNYSGGKGR